MHVELKNTTRKLCVIGDPVLHSKSPLIQNTMLSALGLDYIYLCQPVSAGRAAEWLSAAKVAGYAGFNATMPHKLDLVPLMDELSDSADLIGAVNTIVNRRGRLYGCNTDYDGMAALARHAGLTLKNKNVLILGTGGTSRTAMTVAADLGAAEIRRVSRTGRGGAIT